MEAKVKHYFAQGRGTYGTRRMKYLLAQEGLQVSRRRIGRVLQNTAQIQSARRLRTSPGGGSEPAQAGVYGPSP